MSSSEQAQGQVAPFVAKTYDMVSNPRTDELIRWGRGNNSFLVLDPTDFSQFLLPCYFKHSNFSSFVRQLNTYGFRKVDPDRWEFAHEAFLRGQTHLLPLVMRRKKKDAGGAEKSDALGEDEEILLQEIGRLRKEQKELEEELQGMDRRLQATERRPQQMISFLAKVVEDPNLIPRLISSKKEQQLQQQQRRQELIGGDKKRRVIASSSSSSSSSPSPSPVLASDSDQAGPPFELNPLIEASANFPVEPETPFDFGFTSDGGVSGYRNGVAYVPAMAHVGLGGGGDVAAFEKQMSLQLELEVPETSPVAFPFSLLGHGFI